MEIVQYTHSLVNLFLTVSVSYSTGTHWEVLVEYSLFLCSFIMPKFGFNGKLEYKTC